MASYKVPQDVEAEDKLVGPLSFRQFVYAIIAIASAALAFFLFQAFPLLAIIPLPIFFLFGILALPLRKDQPMETYLLALLRFYLKSKQRLWNPDGTITYVEITAPKMIEQHLTKDFSGMDAKERLNYLASVMDTRGWALKGLTQQAASVTTDVAVEAQSAPDVMSEDAALSKSFDNLIAQNDEQRRQKAVSQMKQAATKPKIDEPAAPTQPEPQQEENIKTPTYNPYPSAIHQKVVQPAGVQKTKTDDDQETKNTSSMTPTVSPDIMRLASNDDLSISAIAHEAHRLEDKNEVVIKLR